VLQTLPYEILGTLAWEANFIDKSFVPILMKDGEIAERIAELVLESLGLSIDQAKDFLSAWTQDLKHAASQGSIKGAWGMLGEICGEPGIIASGSKDEGIIDIPRSRATLSRSIPPST